jgi:uncharacterized membrane protein
MTTEVKILLWWLAFGGTHILGSSRLVRDRLIRALGMQAFKGLYSLGALATFVPLVLVYFGDRHAGAMLFDPPEGLMHLTELLMILALIILGQGLAAPGPMTTTADMSGRYDQGVRGILRVTRHPQNVAFALFGLAHCLVNPTVGDWLFFGGFTVFAVVSSVHQDARSRASGPEAVRRFQDETSSFPFLAIIQGKQRFVWSELSWIALALSLVMAVLLRLYHGRLFGGFQT